MEMKFVKTGIDARTLDNSIELVVNKNRLLISPLEIQMSYKLFLGSEKYIEDARFLFKGVKPRHQQSMNYLGWQK